MKKLIQIQNDLGNEIIPQGIDLTDSFILNWKKLDSEFEIELELIVWPESPYYSKPLKDEFTCYKIGKLTFQGIILIKGFVELESVKPSISADGGSKDWDCIYGFRQEGELFKFSTEFTDIEIKCKGFEIEIKE